MTGRYRQDAGAATAGQQRILDCALDPTRDLVCRLVKVEYEDLPALMSCADAIEAGSFFDVPPPPPPPSPPFKLLCLLLAATVYFKAPRGIQPCIW